MRPCRPRRFAAQISRQRDQSDQFARVFGVRFSLANRRLCNAVQLCFRLWQHRAEGGGEVFVVVLIRLGEHLSHVGIADRQRRRQCQDAIANILIPAAAKRRRPAHVRDVVTGVIENTQKLTELAQLPRSFSVFG